MTDSRFITQLISLLKEQQAAIAEDAMLRPKSKRFEAGTIAGRYQGVQMALDTVDALLRDNYEKETRS
jgi:hypothetical protein